MHTACPSPDFYWCISDYSHIATPSPIAANILQMAGEWADPERRVLVLLHLFVDYSTSQPQWWQSHSLTIMVGIIGRGQTQLLKEIFTHLQPLFFLYAFALRACQRAFLYYLLACHTIYYYRRRPHNLVLVLTFNLLVFKLLTTHCWLVGIPSDIIVITGCHSIVIDCDGGSWLTLLITFPHCNVFDALIVLRRKTGDIIVELLFVIIGCWWLIVCDDYYWFRRGVKLLLLIEWTPQIDPARPTPFACMYTACLCLLVFPSDPIPPTSTYLVGLSDPYSIPWLLYALLPFGLHLCCPVVLRLQWFQYRIDVFQL